MVMEFVMELFFTASISLCLAFLFAKLVSYVGGAQDEFLVSQKDKEDEYSCGFDEGVVKDEQEVEKIEFLGESEVGLVEEVEKLEEFEVGLVEDKFLAEEIADKEVEEEKVSKIDLKLEKKEEIIVKDDVIESGDEGESEKEKEKEELFSEDDDWEGVERSEAAKLFGLASKFVTSGENNEVLSKVGSDVQMQLYGLHKVAIEGPCREPPPLALMVSARAKWNAWQRLGNMTPEVAMEQYVNLLSTGIPGWMGGNSEGDHEQDKGNVAPEAGESRKEAHESLSIHQQPDSKHERKQEELQSHGEDIDAKSL